MVWLLLRKVECLCRQLRLAETLPLACETTISVCTDCQLANWSAHRLVSHESLQTSAVGSATGIVHTITHLHKCKTACTPCSMGTQSHALATQNTLRRHTRTCCTSEWLSGSTGAHTRSRGSSPAPGLGGSAGSCSSGPAGTATARFVVMSAPSGPKSSATSCAKGWRQVRRGGLVCS